MGVIVSVVSGDNIICLGLFSRSVLFRINDCSDPEEEFCWVWMPVRADSLLCSCPFVLSSELLLSEVLECIVCHLIGFALFIIMLNLMTIYEPFLGICLMVRSPLWLSQTILQKLSPKKEFRPKESPGFNLKSRFDLPWNYYNCSSMKPGPLSMTVIMRFQQGQSSLLFSCFSRFVLTVIVEYSGECFIALLSILLKTSFNRFWSKKNLLSLFTIIFCHLWSIWMWNYLACSFAMKIAWSIKVWTDSYAL